MTDVSQTRGHGISLDNDCCWIGAPCPIHKPSGLIAYHIIPVPKGWSPEQAWEAIGRGDLLTDPDPDWAVIRVVGGYFVELVDV